MAAKASIIDLRPNRVLMNPHFESYKLALDTFPSSETKFDIDVLESYNPERSHSFHHAKILSDYNALKLNWNAEGESTLGVAFTVDNELVLIDVGNMFNEKATWKVPMDSGAERFIMSSTFVNENVLLVQNGIGSLFVLEAKKTPSLSLNLLWSGRLSNGDKNIHSALIDNAFMNESGDIDFYSVAPESCNELPDWVRAKLASTAGRGSSFSEESGYATTIFWHRLSKQEGESSWNVSCLGRFVASSPCSLLARGPDGGLIIGGERPFVNMMLPEEIETEHKTKPGDGRLYTWHQDKESVVISFPSIQMNIKKEDVTVTIKRDSIFVKVNNSGEVKNSDNGFELGGNLGGDVDVEASAWVIDDSPEFVKDPYADHRCVKKLEITLAKVEPTTWINCIEGDDRGHMILNEDQLEFVRNLTHPGAKHPRQSIYDDENDDVDAKMCRNGDDDEHEAALHWFDSDGKQTGVSYVGSSLAFLFSRSHPEVDICLKNDVDGCVWRPTAEQRMEQTNGHHDQFQRSFEHIATFDALSYVLSSKENRRFVTCSPDLKLAAAADCRHHVYIYRRPQPGTLINRKSGSNQTVSRQHVIAIDPPEESILGFQVTNSAFFVLTAKRLLRFTLQQQD